MQLLAAGPAMPFTGCLRARMTTCHSQRVSPWSMMPQPVSEWQQTCCSELPVLQDVHGDLGGDGHGRSSMRMSARRPNSLHRQHLDGAPAARSAAKAVSGRPKTGV